MKWCSGKKDVGKLCIQRCLKPTDFGDSVIVELNHFADASSSHGYGACSYLRQISSQGQVHCALVMGKARVIPLKPVTIPRLELTAAVTAISLAKKLATELDIKMSSHRFWTDSTAVLGFLKNEKAGHEIFEANCVKKYCHFPMLNNGNTRLLTKIQQTKRPRDVQLRS